MKIFIGSDHAGFELKQKLVLFLRTLGHDVTDKGAYQFLPDDDYPDFARPVAEAVASYSPFIKGSSESASRGISKSSVTEDVDTSFRKGGIEEEVRGIILGGSGQGEAIVANRIRGIRAVVFNGQYAPEDGRKVPHEIVISREHNDSNILSLGARFLSDEEAKEAVKLWLETPFPGDGRHVRRIAKIDVN